MHRFALAFLAVLSLGSCVNAPPLPSPAALPAIGAGAAWDRLKQVLVGTWTMQTRSGPFVISYKLISGGSVLVEDWGVGSAHETQTVFHPDHAALLLTHYCAQGNQPRLRSVAVSEQAITFRFVDVTNRTPAQAVLVERTLRFVGDALDDTETYRAPDGKQEATTYHLVRIPAP